MRLRGWASARSGRTVCLILLVLFVIVSMVHFVSAHHHDRDGDTLGLLTVIDGLSLILMLLAAVATAKLADSGLRPSGLRRLDRLAAALPSDACRSLLSFPGLPLRR